MPSAGTQIYYALVVAWGATFYQFFLRELFSTTLGLGRVIQDIEDFPFECKRIVHPKLEACEDLWLDDEARVLYAACSTTEGILAWRQAIGKLNVTGRKGSELIALDIDEPGVDGLYNLRPIKPIGYSGARGEGDDSLDLLGFDAEILDGDTIQFYLVNERPPVGPFNNYIDATVVGANSTIDVFEMKRGADVMRHVRTIWSPEVFTPNRIAVLGEGDFLVTNDHSTKIGWRRELDPIIGGGTVAFCNLNSECHTAVTGAEPAIELPLAAKNPEPLYKEYLTKALSVFPKPGLKFPNGLTRGFDNLIYVPSTIDGQIRVYALTPSNTLQLIDTIRTGMPLDNISPDANGDLYVAGFPDFRAALKGLHDPLNVDAPSSVLRIRKTVDVERQKVDYRVEKVVEDKSGKVISGATSVRHDVKTGRLFIGAAIHPFLVVCDPK
ncbi:hypothetical protein HBI56_137760 [Parastagonospora nodorum]|nr:hypothetical protein HBI10_158160 [Parastagonospora nodorum]KAH4018920.1 hypothetical protein HBI13_127930 [Parastagonospora nodorum]KAH4932099.1 hypothetical protein HBI79_106510 [Parastagonospora nodorum]KAH4963691.1 hypothetical protein HBI78_117820 [Parastagonospora nodorum]KAH5096546.1 hypothetical protein HBH72_138300 [Parastagonospora nodorum]